MSSSGISHFPMLSPKNGSPKTSERLKGRIFPTPLEGHISLSSVFSISLFKRDQLIDASAILQDGRMGLTFRQLDSMSRRVAKILDSKLSMITPGEKEAPVNVDGDSVIAILTENSIIDERIVVFLLAILKLGAAYINLQPSKMTESEWKQMIRQVQPLIIIIANNNIDVPEMVTRTKLLCTVNKNSKRKVRLPYQVVTSDELWKDSVQLNYNNNEEITVTPLWSKIPLSDRTAGIFKAPVIPCREPHYIRIGHRALYNRLYWEKMEIPIQDHEKFYLTYPISDPRALIQIFLPLCTGKPLKFLDPNMFKDAAYLLSQIVQWNMFRLYISPKQLDKLLNHVDFTASQKDLAPVRSWLVSGDHFSLELGKKFFEVVPVPTGGKNNKCLLAVFYGTPEVLWSATWCPYRTLREFISLSNNGSVCVGVPLHNTWVHIVDDKNWSHCPLGVKGEICISGGSFGAGGYSGQGVKEKPSVMFQTGDLGRIVVDKDGNKVLILEGKTWTRIKYKGIVIDLKELAKTIENQQIASKCVLFLSPRTRENQTIIAAYVPFEDLGVPSLSALEVNKKIVEIEPLVEACIPVKEIPFTNIDGTVDLKALRREYHTFLTSCSPSKWKKLKVSNEGKLAAKVLCKSVAVSLGHQIDFVIDNFPMSFWSLGGNPIKAVRTISAVKAQGWNLSAEDFAVSGRLDKLVDRMLLAKKDKTIWNRSFEDVNSKIQYEEMSKKYLNDVLRILKTDYNLKYSEVPNGLNRYWRQALEEMMKLRLSVVALIGEKVVGFGLNCKTWPKIIGIPSEITEVLNLFQALMDACKSEVSLNLVGKLAKSFYIAIDEATLTPAQKVLAIMGIINHSIDIARKGGCGSFLVCTANPLIQDITSWLLYFKVLLELPMNRYKTKNYRKPFWNNDDHEKVGVYLKTMVQKTNLNESTSSFTSRSKPQVSSTKSKTVKSKDTVRDYNGNFGF